MGFSVRVKALLPGSTVVSVSASNSPVRVSSLSFSLSLSLSLSLSSLSLLSSHSSLAGLDSFTNHHRCGRIDASHTFRGSVASTRPPCHCNEQERLRLPELQTARCKPCRWGLPFSRWHCRCRPRACKCCRSSRRQNGSFPSCTGSRSPHLSITASANPVILSRGTSLFISSLLCLVSSFPLPVSTDIYLALSRNADPNRRRDGSTSRGAGRGRADFHYAGRPGPGLPTGPT